MNWYKKYIISKKVQPKDDDFSWSYVDVSDDIIKLHKEFTKTIDKDDLYTEEAEKKGDWVKGIEDDCHITLKYGFSFDDPKDVIDCLDGESGGIIKIDAIEIFEQEKYDVLVIKCKSKQLSKLHKKLTDDLSIEDKFPVYKPHISIAYFQKGRAKKYKKPAEDQFIKNIEFEFKEVVFEDRNDKRTKINLD